MYYTAYKFVHVYEMPQVGKFLEMEIGLVGCQGLGEGDQGMG